MKIYKLFFFFSLEIMEKMTAYQEKAFDNLFHWAQAETRIMTKENPEITSLFRDALVILRQRQVLFQYSSK